MSKRVKEGLGFGVFMAVFFIVYHLLTEEALSPTQVFKVIVASIFGGAVSGFLFGWTAGMSFFKKNNTPKQNDQ